MGTQNNPADSGHTATNSARLTKTTVEKIAAPSEGEAVVMDNELKGFGVRVMASGTRTYFVRYRVGGGRGGRLRRHKLGRHGTITAEQARRSAKEILAKVQLGEDPAGDQQAKRAELTVNQLIDAWLAGPGRRNKYGQVRSQQSYDFDSGRLQWHVRPLIGSKKLSSIARADIESLRDAIAAGKTAGQHRTKLRGVARVKGGESAATRTLRTLSIVFSYGVERGFIASNPCIGVRKTPDGSSQRFLTPEELKRLGKSIENAAAEGADARALTIIQLLVLTGCRRSEIEGLEWTELNLPYNQLHLHDSKTGKRTVYLSDAAKALIDAIKRRDEAKWVFPADRGDHHYQGTPKVWRALREKACLTDVRLHDLRHTFASTALATGLPLELIKPLLGHRERRMSDRYAHLSASPIRDAAQRNGNMLSAMMRGLRDTSITKTDPD